MSLAHFFWRPKLQFPPLDFGTITQVRWPILLPPPPDRTAPSIRQTRSILRVGGCPICCLLIFLPPLDHSITHRTLEQLTGASTLFILCSPPHTLKCPPLSTGSASSLSILPGLCKLTLGFVGFQPDLLIVFAGVPGRVSWNTSLASMTTGPTSLARHGSSRRQFSIARGLIAREILLPHPDCPP